MGNILTLHLTNNWQTNNNIVLIEPIMRPYKYKHLTLYQIFIIYNKKYLKIKGHLRIYCINKYIP